MKGTYIAVVQGGFVYVGETSTAPTLVGTEKFAVLKEARNIRVWGTDAGLGQLRTGPTPKTVLDAAGEVWVPWHSLISLHPCTGF